MPAAAEPRALRLWPGVVIVVLQLLAYHGTGAFAAGSPIFFFGMMGSMTLGPLLLIVWWLFFSRARWVDRLGGLALLVAAQSAAMFLSHPSAKMFAMVPGVPWLCAVFVASLFFERRTLTVAAVLVAGLGWTLVRTNGVTGVLGTEYFWRWSPTAEQRFLASSASGVPQPPPAADAVEYAAWPGFRGPGRDGVVRGTTLATDWKQNPPQELWRHRVGPGWSSFALVGSRLCTQEQRDEDEVVTCYDAATGEPIWVHADRARFWEALAGAGPRATPTYHDGRLYTVGATGILNCLDAATGSALWTRNIADDANAALPPWGFASSPLVVDDLVIVHAAGAADGAALRAYDLQTGEPRWSGQAPGAGYCSPQLATIDGVRQVLVVTGNGAYSVAPETGELLWQHDWPMGGDGSRIVQPAVLDDGSVLIGTSFGMGTRKISVTPAGGSWSVEEGWTSTGLKPYYNDTVVHRGHAYGFDGNIMAAIDLASGARDWKGGRYGNGQALLLADQDLLLVLSERGEVALVRASADGFEELARMPALEGKTWNHPVLVDGVLYVRNGEEAAAYRLPG